MELKVLKLADLIESPFNPRKFYDKVALAELSADIGARGVDSPIKVRPAPKGSKKPWEIIFGHRRVKASAMADKDTIPATVVDMNDLEAEQAQVVENDKRKDLQPLEQAESYKGMQERHGLTLDDLALKIGKSRSSVHNALLLCDLAPEGKKALRDGVLPASSAVEIARHPAALQGEALAFALREDHFSKQRPSVRQLKEFLGRDFILNLKKAPFDTEDANLVKEASACTACPTRSDSQPSLLEESGPSLCLNRNCYGKKREASRVAKLEKLKAEGRVILGEKEAASALSYSGPFVKVDEKCMNDSKDRTWSTLLKDTEVTVAIAVDPQSGDLVEVARKEDVKAALKEKSGKDKAMKAAAESFELGGRSSGSVRSAADKAADKKKKTDRLMRVKVAGLALKQLGALKAVKDGADAFLRALVVALLDAVAWTSQTMLAEHVDPEQKKRPSEATKFLLGHSGKLKGPELRAFVLELALAESLGGGGQHGTNHAQGLLNAAKVLDLDLRAIENGLKVQAVEAAKPKATAVKEDLKLTPVAASKPKPKKVAKLKPAKAAKPKKAAKAKPAKKKAA